MSEYRAKNARVYHIPTPLWHKYHSQTSKCAKSMGLKLYETIKSQTETKPLEANSIAAYKKHYRGLRYFCAMTADWESGMMLLDSPPHPFCPSMRPRTIALFIIFKTSPKGTLLKDFDGEPVLDWKAPPLACQGGWNDPDNARQMLTAVGAIHESRGQRGVFSDKCLDCWQLDARGSHSGCRIHRENTKLWRTGTPRIQN